MTYDKSLLYQTNIINDGWFKIYPEAEGIKAVAYNKVGGKMVGPLNSADVLDITSDIEVFANPYQSEAARGQSCISITGNSSYGRDLIAIYVDADRMAFGKHTGDTYEKFYVRVDFEIRTTENQYGPYVHMGVHGKEDLYTYDYHDFPFGNTNPIRLTSQKYVTASNFTKPVHAFVDMDTNSQYLGLPYIVIDNKDGLSIMLKCTILVSTTYVYGLGNEPGQVWCSSNINYDTIEEQWVEPETPPPGEDNKEDYKMRLEWDKTGDRRYETGTKNGVL